MLAKQAVYIIVHGVKTGDVPNTDRTYLIRPVESNIGIQHDDALRRVDATISEVKDAANQARQTADAAWKSTPSFAIFSACDAGWSVRCHDRNRHWRNCTGHTLKIQCMMIGRKLAYAVPMSAVPALSANDCYQLTLNRTITSRAVLQLALAGGIGSAGSNPDRPAKGLPQAGRHRPGRVGGAESPVQPDGPSFPQQRP